MGEQFKLGETIFYSEEKACTWATVDVEECHPVEAMGICPCSSLHTQHMNTYVEHSKAYISRLSGPDSATKNH